MTKKKKGKVVQMLSPENYIRKKARSLPIHECWINDEWEDAREASIIIARKHTNGNFTVGFFLVDLLCLGVKDAYFDFNIIEPDYKETLERMEEYGEMKKISYTLAHNIIFSGLEFADDYDFKPHKKFTSTMQYFLEEDTDDIELVEIECGHNNQPMYVQGHYENEAEGDRILAQLEKKAGKGNYQFIRGALEDILPDVPVWDDDDDFEEEDLDLTDKYEDLTTEQKIELFLKQVAEIEKMTTDEWGDFADLGESIINEHINHDKSDELFDNFSDKLEEIEIVDEIPDEMLGIDYLSAKGAEELKSQFPGFYNLMETGKSKARKKIKELQKELPHNPAVCYLELTWLQANDPSHYTSKLKKYSAEFPDYALIKMLKQINSLNNDLYTGQDIPFENAIE